MAVISRGLPAHFFARPRLSTKDGLKTAAGKLKLLRRRRFFLWETAADFQWKTDLKWQPWKTWILNVFRDLNKTP